MSPTLSAHGRRAAVLGGLGGALALFLAAVESSGSLPPVFALLGIVFSVPPGALLGYAVADALGVSDRRVPRMACAVAGGTLLLATALLVAARHLGASIVAPDLLISVLWFDLVVAAVAVGEAIAIGVGRMRAALHR